MRVNRAELVQALESVVPGLANREVAVQSSCFAFTNGRVMTFNEQIACWHASPLGDLVGAVAAKPLMDILAKMPDEVLEVDADDAVLVVKGKHRRARVRLEATVELPINEVEEATKWRAVHEDFCEAIALVQGCAGSDEELFSLTCVHLHTEWIEACDNFQMARFPIETGLRRPTLVRQASIKHITGMGMTDLAETKTWLHFRNPGGLIMACRRYLDDYPDLTAAITASSGKKVTLPGGLDEVIERCEVFSAENMEATNIRVRLGADRLRLVGEGTRGDYIEDKKVSYAGPPLDFLINPKILTLISKKHSECRVSPTRLHVDGGRFMYMTVLGKSGGDVPPAETDAPKRKARTA